MNENLLEWFQGLNELTCIKCLGKCLRLYKCLTWFNSMLTWFYFYYYYYWYYYQMPLPSWSPHWLSQQDMSSSFSRHLNVCLGLVLRQFLLLLLLFFFNLLWETEYSVRTGIAYTSLWLAHNISKLLLWQLKSIFLAWLCSYIFVCFFPS